MNKTTLCTVVAVLASLGTMAPRMPDRGADLPVTVFLLRHAETVPQTDQAPKRLLSAAGEERASALQRLLGRAGVTHVFSTDYPRTRDTVGPLAATAGVKVALVSARRSDQQVRALRALPAGAVAVVAGHSNTIPGLIKALGGTVTGLDRRGMLAETSHDRLFQLTLSKAAPVKTIELRYGRDSAPAPDGERRK